MSKGSTLVISFVVVFWLVVFSFSVWEDIQMSRFQEEYPSSRCSGGHLHTRVTGYREYVDGGSVIYAKTSSECSLFAEEE